MVGLGEEVGAELKVIVEVERALGLKALTEVGNGHGLFLFAHAAELLVGVLRHPRRSTSSPIVVGGRRRRAICGHRVVVCVVVVEGRHYRLMYKR